MKYLIILLLMTPRVLGSFEQVLVPIDVTDRSSLDELELTTIGAFGIMRKARPTVPTHYHTGIDIKRPGTNYKNSLIYPIAEGIVISSRDDGPYAQLIIEHEGDTFQYWSVYEHIAGIKIDVDQRVTIKDPIARFMNRVELEHHGWQFDHFHLEVLKIMPIRLKGASSLPQRRFKSYTLACTTEQELKSHFFDPLQFIESHLQPR